MIFKNFKFSTKKRRGLSSIVGALLFVVLMVSTFSVLGVALNSQSDIASTGRDVASVDLKKQQEDWGINVFADPPVGTQAELFIQVTNDGQNPVEISTVIVAEITDFTFDFPSNSYDIPVDLSLVSSGKQEHILPSNLILLDLADPLTTGIDQEVYTIKVISSLGTIQMYSIVCDDTVCGIATTAPGQGRLTSTLFLDGPNAINTKISTVIMFVTNTSEETVIDVQPFRGFNGIGDCDTNNFHDVITLPPDDTPIVEEVTLCSVSSNLPVDLGPHEVAIFKWDFTVGGDIDTEFRFCNYAFGTDPTPATVDSQPESCDELVIIDPNDCGGCGPGGDQVILIDDLLIRPSLFMIIPGPFGLATNSDPGQAVWGVNVVNPTEKPMSVTKITIVSYPPGANANHKVFDPTTCDLIGIEPLETQPNPGPYDWSCPGENTIMWQNIGAPLPIAAYSSQSFLVKVNPGSIVGSVDLDALIVQANAFTTTGSFGKSAYQTTMYDIPETMVNVFLTDADLTIPEDPTDNDHIFSQRLGIQDLVAGEYKITLADMDANDDTYIKKGANIVINVPREWTDVVITDDTNFKPDGGTTAPDDDRVTVFNDESTQIIVVTDVDVGGNAIGNDLQDHITLTFTANPPDNEGDPLKPYIMYVLAYGQTGHCVSPPTPCDPMPRPLGPLNEIFLQVKD